MMNFFFAINFLGFRSNAALNHREADQTLVPMELERKLSRIPSYSRELGLDLRKPGDRFKWFLASMLFAKRISSEIARKTYKLFEAEGLTTPDALLRVGWDRLVEVLDAGGYVRYDFSTATNLLEMAKGLKQQYGDLERLHEEAAGPRELERLLQGLRGIGPTATNSHEHIPSGAPGDMVEG